MLDLVQPLAAGSLSVFVGRHGATNPADKVRCNMWKQIELGGGDCNFTIKSVHFFAWGRLGHDASGRGGCVVASSGPPSREPRRVGALTTRVQIANSVDMMPGLRELIALTLLAGLGCGLALAHGDFLFIAVFGGAIAMTIETIRRFP